MQNAEGNHTPAVTDLRLQPDGWQYLLKRLGSETEIENEPLN
jgi:hypothetical protein